MGVDSDDDYITRGATARSPWEALSFSPSPSGLSDIESIAQLVPEIEEVSSFYYIPNP